MKKTLLAFLSVLVLGTLVALFGVQKTVNGRLSDDLKETNKVIRELENEKSGLEKQLGVSLDKLNATLCFSVADEQLYSEIYPILEEQDLTGVIILRNDQLPGDKYAIPVQDFLNLLQAGWSSAISLSRPQGESDEAWKSRVQTYMQKL